MRTRSTEANCGVSLLEEMNYKKGNGGRTDEKETYSLLVTS